MTDATIWHDPQRDRWYIQRKHYIEEIFPLTLEYMKDQQAENERLRELLAESFMDVRLYAEKYGISPFYGDVDEHLNARLRDIGIEVD